MSLSVCLLLDDRADRAVRGLWQRLERAGVATLATHTHGRHVPHLTLASLLSADLGAVRTAVTELPPMQPLSLRFDALGMFPRSRSWLVPAVTADLTLRQERVVDAVVATGAALHRSYRPGSWLPHLTLAPRLRLEDLPVLARHAFEVLPLEATLVRTAAVDTSTGHLTPL
jgi:2'-5' RNA ligase